MEVRAHDEAVCEDGDGDVAATLDEVEVPSYDAKVVNRGVWHVEMGRERLDDSYHVHDPVLARM